jgi:radical SAM protein with 4Fe4S-binding SPASM domain
MKTDKLNNLIRASSKVSRLLQKDFKFESDVLPVCLKNITWKQRLNLLKSGFNLLKVSERPYAYPDYMMVELTNYCNLKCPICPTGKGLLKRKPANMEVSLFQQLWNETSPYILTAYLWDWGEPLLHPEIKDILRIAHSTNTVTILSTNGQNLNDRKVIEALLCYPVQYLIVALDGIADETLSKFRVGATLEPALEGVKQLVTRRYHKYPIVHLRYIPMKHNEHELPNIAKWARDNYFDSYSIRTLSIIDDKDTTHNIMKPDNPKYRAYEYKDNQRVQRNDYICDKIFSFPSVLVNGDVIACGQDYNGVLSYGNLKEQSFKNIWFSDRAKEIRHNILTNKDMYSFCRNCCFRDRAVDTCSIEFHDLRKGIKDYQD